MLSRPVLGDALSSVWNLVSDGRWHRLSELVTGLRLTGPQVREIVDFLVAHGFGEKTIFKQESFRLSGLVPSPIAVAQVLQELSQASAFCVSWRHSS